MKAAGPFSRRSRMSGCETKAAAIILLLAALAAADQRTQPPTIATVAPTGVTRGKSSTIEMEGSRLEGTSRILFSDTAVTGRIIDVKEIPQEDEVRSGTNKSVDLGDRPPKIRVTVEVTAAERAEPGVVRFRLLTPLGTTNTATIAVSPFEITKFDPAKPVNLPATITGVIAKPGDTNQIQFKAKSNEQYVFQAITGAVGSPLEAEMILLDGTGARIATVHDNVMITPFLDAGRYTLEIRDFQRRGGARFSYRLNAGATPYITGAFPLGFERGKKVEVALSGSNLEGHERWTAEPNTTGAEMVKVPEALNQIRLSAGDYPEVFEREGPRRNDTPQTAQRVPLPVTINGVIAGGMVERGAPDRDYFQFSATKGQRLKLEVSAQRLGSPLDSVIEVLDRQGNPIERATLRPMWETSVALRDAESTNGAFRILSYAGLHVNDYVYAGNELLRVATLPRGPDEDIFFVTNSGRRVGYLDTTPASVALNAPVYRVEIHEPGAKFPPNGMPVAHLYYRSDDAQGIAPTRDSLVHFTAPETADYLVRIADSRDTESDRFAYRLTIGEERPDFSLSATPQNPNVPRGGSVAVQVTAMRIDGFDDPIQVKMEGLPAGVTALPAVIGPGQDTTWIQLTADRDAEIAHPASIHVVAVSGKLMHEADAGDRLRLLALAPPPDVKLWIETPSVALAPGGKTRVSVRVERANGFTGRVPVDIRNLPPGVRIPDIGLNGVLINEQETTRSFELIAEDWAPATDQPIFAVARVETRSPTPSAYASGPMRLRVR